MKLMFFELAAILTLAAVPKAAVAEIPNWCCPSSCETSNTALSIVTDGPGDLPFVTEGGQEIPFARSFYLGEATDNRVHICIGYNSFGDREVKCLLTPPMM